VTNFSTEHGTNGIHWLPAKRFIQFRSWAVIGDDYTRLKIIKHNHDLWIPHKGRPAKELAHSSAVPRLIFGETSGFEGAFSMRELLRF
jgi:hypothetical protein